MTKLQFRPGYQHICQLSADKGIIFYTIADILVYYSIFAIRCIREEIVALAFSIMLNHVHFEGYFKTESRMVSLLHGINTSFAKTYNSNYGLQGPVFQHGFQHSQRYGEQKIRDTFIYIGNNGKVKTPGIQAEDYRWNLIKYLMSHNPFSETIDFRTASPNLLYLLSEVLNRSSTLSLAESSKLSTQNALSFALEQNYDFRRLVSTLKAESGCSDYELSKFFHLLD